MDADANAEEKSRSSTASLGNPQVRPNEAADRSSILYFEGGMDTLEPTVHPSSHENIPPGSSESCIIGDSATTVKDPAQEGKWRPPGTEAAASVQSTTTELSSAETEFSVEEFSKGLAPAEQYEIRDLSLVLPGFPIGRLKRIRNAFKTSLGYPSLLTLVPLLRERMPDYMSSAWLKSMNTRNADFALAKAIEDEIVDIHMLNAVLQVKTSVGSLDTALEFHRDEFRKHELVSSSTICLSNIEITL